MESEIEATPPRESRLRRTAKQPGWWNGWLLGCWVVVIVAFACVRAKDKSLWYDELFTFYLAQLPGVGDLWSALTSGADLNPPLHYLAVRGAFDVFGASELSLRLPSVLGYVIMSLCLYAFAARRVAPACAWAAATFPLLTQAYGYSHEGRPYGLVLGFTGLALLAWQAAAEGPRRVPALVLMALALAAGVSTHFFAVLIFVPIGMGELARAWSRRRPDLPAWIALVAGLIPLVFFKDILRSSSVYKESFWAKPTWAHNISFYLTILKDTGVPLLMALTLLVIVSRFVPPGGRGDDLESKGPRDPVPLHEWVAMLGLIALPVIGFLVAKRTSQGAFTERYALATALGFGLLIAYGVGRLGAGRSRWGVVMALTFFGWFILHEGYRLQPGREPHSRISARDFRCAEGSDLPLVISLPYLYLQSYHDLPLNLTERLVFVTYGRSTDEIALRSLSRWVPLKVVDKRRFLEAHDRFFLCGYPENFFFRSLLEGDAKLTMLQSRRYREGEAILALVDQRSGADPSARMTSAHESTGREGRK